MSEKRKWGIVNIDDAQALQSKMATLGDTGIAEVSATLRSLAEQAEGEEYSETVGWNIQIAKFLKEAAGIMESSIPNMVNASKVFAGLIETVVAMEEVQRSQGLIQSANK